MTTRFDVLTIGNAIVDIIAQAEDDFLVREGIVKGAMNLIDTDRAEHLYAVMGPAIEASGGSAANTAAGIASLGGRAAYFGKVADDPLGTIFAHDIRASGVHYATRPLNGHPPTARSMIFVTPDGERSMNTYLGACVELGPDDIDEAVVAQSKVTFFEGYLWDPPRAKDAIRLAAKTAHAHGRNFSMTLSDPFCVDRYRDEFLELMRSRTVDIVFANEAELKSLYQTAAFEAALEALRVDCAIGIVTRSEKGCVVVTREETHAVPAHPIEKLVDTTGAGDLFAAGFLFGLTNGRDLPDCARIGAMAAALVIQQVGPRPREPLRAVLAEEGL
ncbi:MAG: adenosine kinase [Alphaproteobacteria bacterium]|nr:MAG: adenosine kinase [Alphaproteobacteria bacterium]